jgi:hypothetical protein
MGEEDVGLANEAEQRLISTKATGQRAARECAEESRDDDNKMKRECRAQPASSRERNR